jgi:hypothetical protein
MMRITLALLLAFLATPSTLFAQPLTFLVDNFTSTVNGGGDFVSDPTPVDGNATWGSFGTTLTGVVGGHRTLGNFLQVSSGGGFGDTNVSTNFFRIANPDNSKSAGQLIWDGTNNLPTGSIPGHPASGISLGVDLAAALGGTNFDFQFSVRNNDLRTWTYTMRAYTSLTDYYTGMLTTNVGGDGITSVVLSIADNDFTPTGNPSWSNINAFAFSAFYATGPLGGDLSLDFIQFVTVPELSSILALPMMLVLGGSIFYLRHGKKRGKQQPVAETANTGAEG